MNLRKSMALMRGGVLESLHYRLSTFTTLFANLIYLVLVYYLWKAIYASSGTDTVNGMTFNDTMIYLLLATALFNFLEMYLVWDMSRSIQSGQIVLDLLKPMKYRKYIFWNCTGPLMINFVLNFVPTFLIVLWITGGAIPMGINLLYFMVSTILALMVNFNIDMIVATICLYTESTWGINIVKETIVLLLSGATIPLAFFPEGLANVIHWFPFRAVYDAPLSILLEKNGCDDILGVLETMGFQLAWAVILSIAGILFWRHAVKKITVNGG